MKALFTSFHMLYCLSRYSKYSLRYGRMSITVWGTCPWESPPLSRSPSVDLRGATRITFELQVELSDQSDNSRADWRVLFLVFHGHQSACKLSLWLLSYRCSKIDTGDGISTGQFPVLQSAYHISENTWIIETSSIAYESPSTGLSYASNIMA